MAITNASTLAEYASGIGTQNSTLTVDSGNKRVGVGTTNPLGTFQVGSGVTFWGDAGIGSFTSLKLSGDTDSTSISTGALTVTGGVGIGLSLTVGGDVSVGGTITYEDVTNVDSIGIVTARSGVRIVGGGLTCVGVATFFNNIRAEDGVHIVGGGLTCLGIGTFFNRVLVGTTTEGYADADDLTVANSSHTGMTIRSGTSSLGTIAFSDAITGAGEYDGYVQYDQDGRSLRFGTAQSERLRITSAGRVGIGSAIPQTTLDVLGELTLPHNNTLRWVLGTTTKFDMYSNSGGTLIFRSTGNERMRINSTGQLLLGHHTAVIGHSGIDGYLQVTGSGTDDSSMTMSRFSADTWCPFITMGKSRNATKGGNTIVQDDDYLGYINFAGNDGTDFNNPAAYIAAQVDGTPGTDDMPGRLVFATTADGSNSATERLRIKSNGFLGIGTNNPARKFHVNDDNSEIALYQSGNANGSYINYKLGANGAELGMIGSGAAILSGGADASDFGIRSSGDLCFSSNGHAEKMRLDTNGKLGIGIISPDSLLHVHNGSAGSIAASSAANLTIESSDASYNVLQFLSPATAAQQIRFGDPADNGAGWIQYNHSSNALQFGTAGPEKMRITSYGDVGIGSTTPWDPSWGTEGNAKHLSVEGATYGCLSLKGSNSSNPTKWTMGAGDGRLYMAYSEDTATHCLDIVRTTKDVHVMAGNLVIGTAGKGIDFSAATDAASGETVSSSVLSDYERGTFDPVIRGGNDTTNQVAGVGQYTRIGDIAHYRMSWINVDLSSIQTGTSIRIGNLPFTTDFNGEAGYGTCSEVMVYNVTTHQYGQYFYSEDGVNYITGLTNASYGGWNGWASTDWNQSGVYIALNITVEVD